MLGSLRTVPRRARAVLGGPADHLRGRTSPRPAWLLVGGIVPREREIASVSGPISRGRREISRPRDQIALIGGIHPRPGAALTLASGTQTHVAAGLMHLRVDAPCEVAIARGLIAVSRQLISIGA
jgi:hypothetical protein